MRDMCVCKRKRRPAHAMSRVPPRKRIACSGADPLQIPRYHCDSAAKSSGNASRLGRGTAASKKCQVTKEESRTTTNEPICAFPPANFKLWMTPETELVFTRERSCQAPDTTSRR